MYKLFFKNTTFKLLISFWCLCLLAFNVSAKDYIHSCEYADRQEEVRAMACTLYFEARSHEEGVVGLYAVAFTTMNRVMSPRYPNSVREVVYQPYMYSWTNDGRTDRVYDRESWYRCLKVAEIILNIKAVDYQFYDITNGALFYHANHINPVWASDKYKTVTINNHSFYWNDVKKHEINLK